MNDVEAMVKRVDTCGNCPSKSKGIFCDDDETNLEVTYCLYFKKVLGGSEEDDPFRIQKCLIYETKENLLRSIGDAEE